MPAGKEEIMKKTLVALALGAAMSMNVMAVEKIVNASADAPAAIGPYSQAILVGNTLYLSGQLPLDPKTGKIVGGTITDATRQVMNNLGAVLAANGMTMHNVVLSNVYVKDLNEFGELNKAYGEYFTDGKAPARVTVEVARIPRDAKVEISMIAVK